MRKWTWCLLLVIALFAAPGTAFAAPDRVTPDRAEPSLMQRMWEGLLRFLDLDGDDFRERFRETEGPRNVSGADDTGGHVDPDG